MSVKALNWAKGQVTAPGGERLVFMGLAHAHNPKNSPDSAWPSHADLAAFAGLSRRSVIRHLAALSRRGVIQDTGERAGKTGRTVIWRLCMDEAQLPFGGSKPGRAKVPPVSQPNSAIVSHHSEPSNGDTMESLFNGDNSEPNGDTHDPNGANGVTRNSKRKGNRNTQDGEQCAAVFAAWNAIAEAHNLPVASKLTESRRTSLKKRIAEHGVEAILSAVETIPDSQFLIGHGRDGWRAHFDWLLQPSSMTKLVEGAYANAPAMSQETPMYERWHQERAKP